MEKYVKSINFDIPSIKKIKIDIGLSYNAPQSKIWLDKEPDLMVIGFEPNPENISSIESKNIQKKNPGHGEPLNSEYIGTRFFLIPVALGNVNKPSEMDFYCMNNDSGTSSLLKPIEYRLGKIKEIVKVPVYSLKHFFDLFPWNKFEYIEYIKIDAQGYDLDILKGAGDYLKDKVVFITAEPECFSYEGAQHNNVTNIHNYLNEQNFIRINHPLTDDPTFINKKFLHLIDKIFIYQRG